MEKLCLKALGFMLVNLFALQGLSASYIGYKNFESSESNLKALVFLSKTCPCSVSHVDHLNELAQRYTNFKLFGVISEAFTPENKEALLEYYSESNFKFPLIEDKEQVLVKKYKALKTPHLILLQKSKESNKYKKIYEGGVTNGRFFKRATKKYLQENLKALSQKEELKYAHGRSLGCYIRRL